MDIAIIGAGNVGRALATAFTRAGHTVVIASRDPEDAGAVAVDTGSRPVVSNADAAGAAEVIVLAVPLTSVPEIAAEIAGQTRGKTIVDVTNRIAFGAAGPEIDTSDSNAERIAALFPDADVVKAFNTLFASRQADPIVEGTRIDGYVAGDSVDAKRAVLGLVASIGLRPVDVGPLVRARQLEGLAFLNMVLNIENQGAWQSGWTLVAAPQAVAA